MAIARPEASGVLRTILVVVDFGSPTLAVAHSSLWRCQFHPRGADGRPLLRVTVHERSDQGEGMHLGRVAFGVGCAALGAIGLYWGAFDNVWQPIPPDFPAYQPLAYLLPGVLLLSGLGLVKRSTAGVAAWAAAAVYFCFTIPWLIRVIRFPSLFGTWGGCAEELVLVIAAVGLGLSLTKDERAKDVGLRTCQVIFGLCAIAFGLNHFFALPQTAEMVPAWIPPGKMFWAVTTGVFHVAAGVAILSGIWALLAARLLAGMMLAFGVFVWAPKLLETPDNHIVWSGNAINFTLMASALVMADLIAGRKSHKQSRQDTSMSADPESEGPVRASA